MAPTSSRASVVTTAPLEEKVVVVEQRAGQTHSEQYGLKMLGAAMSSEYSLKDLHTVILG
jgi:hypothetical protein